LESVQNGEQKYFADLPMLFAFLAGHFEQNDNKQQTCDVSEI